ncbi:phosphoribosylglycinamide formyltransferase [Candidatus Peregrinibacteria bacterium]|nr:phosphoribosylglycinamide formyltransferase [Candidatus Peregrinibacteria bacterium]
MFKLGVLASTRGTDLQAIIDEIKAGKMPGIEIAVVVSDKKNCYALQRAESQGYKTVFVDRKHTAGVLAHDVSEQGERTPQDKIREEYDLKLAEIFKKEKVDLIALIGYMRILTSGFVKQFKNKIINVHPALIPKFCGPRFFGKSVHEAVLRAKEKESGMTIHYVEEGVDMGKIILQKKCKILPNETPETLKEKVQALEKKWYPEVIRRLAKQNK